MIAGYTVSLYLAGKLTPENALAPCCSTEQPALAKPLPDQDEELESLAYWSRLRSHGFIVTEGSKRMHKAFSRHCLRPQQTQSHRPVVFDAAILKDTRRKVLRLLCLARCQEVFFGVVYGWLLLENFSLEHVVMMVAFFGFALIDTANLVRPVV